MSTALKLGCTWINEFRSHYIYVRMCARRERYYSGRSNYGPANLRGATLPGSQDFGRGPNCAALVSLKASSRVTRNYYYILRKRDSNVADELMRRA